MGQEKSVYNQGRIIWDHRFKEYGLCSSCCIISVILKKKNKLVETVRWNTDAGLIEAKGGRSNSMKHINN